MNDLKKARGRKQVQDNYSLDHIDQKLLRQISQHPSTPLRELSTIVGLSKSGVQKRIKKPEFQRVLAEQAQTTSESIKDNIKGKERL